MPDNIMGLEEKVIAAQYDIEYADTADEELIFAEGSQNAVFRSLKKVIDSSYTRHELFMKLCARLDKFFAINRASLAIYNSEEDSLTITHIQVGREFKSGVHINILAEKTLMKKVLKTGHILVSDFADHSGQLEIEQKILLDKNSKSLAIIPLAVPGKKIGILNITSSSYCAFNILKSHLFDYLFHKTAEKLAELPQ